MVTIADQIRAHRLEVKNKILSPDIFHATLRAEMAGDARFAQRLAWAMERKKASGRALARRVGVTEGAIRKWLRGRTRPQETFLALCALQLDVDPQWLAEGTGKPDAPRVSREGKKSLSVALLIWQRRQISKTTADLRKLIEEHIATARKLNVEGLEILPMSEQPIMDLKETIDDVTSKRYDSAVISGAADKQVKGLMKDVKRLTMARGSRARLARFLRVRPQRLNEWLNQKRVPRGGISLLLRDWVRAEEARQQQQKGSEGAETPSKPARQKRKPNK